MLQYVYIGGKSVVVSGIGKLYYQDGFPISMTHDILKERNIGISWLNVADELYKNGWTETRCLTVLRQEIDNDETYNEVESFIKAAKGTKEKFYTGTGYEDQREMIFNSLFKDKEEAKIFLRNINII